MRRWESPDRFRYSAKCQRSIHGHRSVAGDHCNTARDFGQIAADFHFAAGFFAKIVANQRQIAGYFAKVARNQGEVAR